MKNKFISICFYLLIGGSLFFYLFQLSSKENNSSLNDFLLFIGKDQTSDSSRADALMLMSNDPKKKQLNILSLPRDSLVSIPCGIGKEQDKIAHSYPLGETYWKNNGRGFSCTTQTVEDLFALKTIYTLEVEMKELADIIDKIGSIFIEPIVTFCDNSICFKKGEKVELTKDNLLPFVRHRATFKDQDLTRIKNQQLVITALFNHFKGMSTLQKSKYSSFFLGKVKTNYPKNRLLNLLDVDLEINITSATLKGESLIKNDIYYYKIDKNDLSYYKAYYRSILES